VIEFFVENYVIFLTVAILFLMALIGYYAQKSNLVKKKDLKYNNHRNNMINKYTFNKEEDNKGETIETNSQNVVDQRNEQKMVINELENNEMVSVEPDETEMPVLEFLNVQPLHVSEENNFMSQLTEEPPKKLIEENETIDLVTQDAQLLENNDFIENNIQEDLIDIRPLIDNENKNKQNDSEGIINIEPLLTNEDLQFENIEDKVSIEENIESADSFKGVTKDESIVHDKVKDYLKEITNDIHKLEQSQNKNSQKLETQQQSLENVFESDEKIDEILNKDRISLDLEENIKIEDLDVKYEELYTTNNIESNDFELPIINLSKTISDDEIWN